MGNLKNALEGINLDNGYISEKDILKVRMRMNRGLKAELPEDGLRITPEQTQKGLAWLKDQWKTPRGIERKNNPFGYREEDAIENFVEFRLVDFYQAATYYAAVQMGLKFYLPVYAVIGKETSFQYYVQAGKVNIIG